MHIRILLKQLSQQIKGTFEMIIVILFNSCWACCCDSGYCGLICGCGGFRFGSNLCCGLNLEII